MVNFIFCIHNHQPVGNFDYVLEEAYVNSYYPFLKAVSKYPSLKLSYHVTGFLLDWIEAHHPEFIELLRKMIERGQVEMLGGGYYEPILSVIPERDRRGQLQMMSDRLEGLFGTRPRGVWLAERVWEPTLPSTLNTVGIEYVVLDDYHFTRSGLEEKELTGYYTTEDQGRVVKVFPGSERLRYLMPFKPVEHVTQYLECLADDGSDTMALYADDGEKFGVWPGTKKWVFDDGWLKGFLKGLSSMKGSVRSVTFSQFLDKFPSKGLVYLPTASYMEMGHWALPARACEELNLVMEDIKGLDSCEQIKRFIHGGTWRNFFSKYPESNWMHKRMLMVSESIREASSGGVGGFSSTDKASLVRARRYLFMAQSNDPFWHGIFGGLYMPHIRGAAYENILRAEGALFEAGDSKDLEPRASLVDVDADGNAEAILRSDDLNLFIKPSKGGVITEIDYKPAFINLSNTLTRRPESYHSRLLEEAEEAKEGSLESIHDLVAVKEEGLEEYLNFDSITRASFVERFLSRSVSLESFSRGEFEDMGDFAQGRYHVDVKNKDTGKKKRGVVNLTREGIAGKRKAKIKKSITTKDGSSFKVSYEIELLSPAIKRAKPLGFGVELNLILPACAGPACSYGFSIDSIDGGEATDSADLDLTLRSIGELKDVGKVELKDTYTGVSVSIEPSDTATLWRFPIETVSLSESGFERIFQGSSLLFLFPQDFNTLKQGAIFKSSFMVSIGSI